MASRTDWSSAFLEQAKDDLKAARALAISPAKSYAVICMLLQMVFEKLSKAALIRQGYDLEAIQKFHKAATSFMLLLRNDKVLREQLEQPASVFGLTANVRELERLHPSNSQGKTPKLEYPWEDPGSGAVLWPAAHLELVRRYQHPADMTMSKLIKLATVLTAGVEKMLPLSRN
jgi:hypothetical protein